MLPKTNIKVADDNLAKVIGLFKKKDFEAAMRIAVNLPVTVALKSPDIRPNILWESFCKIKSTDKIAEAIIRFVEGICSYKLGQQIESRKAFEKCIRTAKKISEEDGGWALICSAETSLVHILYRESQTDKAVYYARHAANLAKSYGMQWLEGYARVALSNVLREVVGQKARSRAALQEAHRLFYSVQPPDLLAMAFVRRQEARHAIDSAKPSEALVHLGEARKVFKKNNQKRALAHSRIDQAWAHFHLRQIEIARDFAEDGLRQSEEIGDASGELRAKRLLGWLALDKGHSETAVSLFTSGMELAAKIGDTDEQSENMVALAWVYFTNEDYDNAEKIVKLTEPLVIDRLNSREGLQWQALSLGLKICSPDTGDVYALVRKFHSILIRNDSPRITLECLALVSFQLAKCGKLREAAPILKESITSAAQLGAAGWIDRYMNSISSVDTRQWVTSLVTEIAEKADLAEQFEALKICAIAGLHDVKNLATSAYSELELYMLEEEINDSELFSVKESAFKAGKLAAEVEHQIIQEKTQIVVQSHSVDIVDLLNQIKQTIEYSSALGSCDVKITENLPHVLADERFLARVFGNLKSNSERYAPRSNISLSASFQPGNKKEIIIGFADNGPGMNPEDAEIIFNAFKDPNQYKEKRANHGTGFGLHYCKLVIEAMGGSIWVDPRPGKGSAFYFTLPAVG